MTYAELIYICADLSKSMTTDDSYLNESHIKFLLDKYRAQLLYEKYKDIKKQIPYSNYQTLTLDLEEVNMFEGNPCANGEYLASIEELPSTLPISNTRVYPIDYYNTNVTFVSRDRMKYVGYNKYLNNIIYCSQGADNKLYFKSNNPQHKYLSKVKVTGIFETPSQVNSEDNYNDEPFTQTFPLEESLIPILIQQVIQTLTGAAYKPEDFRNNSTDDLSDLIAWARNNMKS